MEVIDREEISDPESVTEIANESDTELDQPEVTSIDTTPPDVGKIILLNLKLLNLQYKMKLLYHLFEQCDEVKKSITEAIEDQSYSENDAVLFRRVAAVGQNLTAKLFFQMTSFISF